MVSFQKDNTAVENRDFPDGDFSNGKLTGSLEAIRVIREYNPYVLFSLYSFLKKL